MGMPSISISFTELAMTALARGERGIIAMIIKDTVPAVNPVECVSAVDVPTTLSAESQKQIKLALMAHGRTSGFRRQRTHGRRPCTELRSGYW